MAANVHSNNLKPVPLNPQPKLQPKPQPKLRVGCLAASMLLFALGAARAAAPAPGAVAPAFRLPDQTGKVVSLADQRGKWVVLYFYAKDNTPGCTTEACDFRDNISGFHALHAVVLGISVDDVTSHKGFAAEHRLPFSILADTDKQVSKDYGVLHRPLGLMELARRETFIVDPQGRIAKHYRDVRPEQHSRQVLADLKALQAQTH
jgi:thioredoxin-dependent peroxiredoxin